VIPYRVSNTVLRQAFSDLITSGSGAEFTPLDQEKADRAAELRARYNLSLTDAFQIAIALTTNCDAFLTNDITLKRVTEINVIVLDETEAG
jgi:predicted nucleic acid-binding protein